MATESAGTATSALSAWTTWLWTPSQVPTCQVPQPIFKSVQGSCLVDTCRYIYIGAWNIKGVKSLTIKACLLSVQFFYRDQRSEKQLAKVPRRVKVSLRLVPKNINVNCTRTSGDAGSTQWVRSIMSDPCATVSLWWVKTQQGLMDLSSSITTISDVKSSWWSFRRTFSGLSWQCGTQPPHCLSPACLCREK